jgi:hypothetical protein
VLGYLPPRDSHPQYSKDVPKELQQIISTCLSTNPSDRTLSAKCLAEELQKVVGKKCSRLSGLTIEGRERRAADARFWYKIRLSLTVTFVAGAGAYFYLRFSKSQSTVKTVIHAYRLWR